MFAVFKCFRYSNGHYSYPHCTSQFQDYCKIGCFLLIHSSSDPSDVWELKPETSFVKNDEDLTVVEPDQLIESFKYGSELIAVSGNSKFGGETQFSKF